MDDHWLPKLCRYVESKTIVVLRLTNAEVTALAASKNGFREFSLHRPHEELQQVRPRQLCLVGGPNMPLTLSIISSCSPDASLDSRIKVRHGRSLKPKDLTALTDLLPGVRYKNALASRLADESSVVGLSPKLSHHVLSAFGTIISNREPLRRLAEILFAPTRYESNLAVQEDAFRTALRVFGIEPNAEAEELDFFGTDRTALSRVHLNEDSVVEYDAKVIAGMKLEYADMTGRAVFKASGEQLEVYTANKRPLEECFGVDLIYLNQVRRNMALVQYKMLNREGHDWVYRPDAQLEAELDRMRCFQGDFYQTSDDYRLAKELFFLKFVRRDALLGRSAIMLPLSHYEQILDRPEMRGPKGGLRLSYNLLGGQYLRSHGFLELIRSGYVGSYESQTNHLEAIVKQIVAGGKAVVAAIQSRR